MKNQVAYEKKCEFNIRMFLWISSMNCALNRPSINPDSSAREIRERENAFLRLILIVGNKRSLRSAYSGGGILLRNFGSDGGTL